MAFLKKYNIPRILLIAVIIVSLVAFSSYTAPKARAEAFTLTSLFLMLVMSVMASLGVTLVATALQQGIDYLHDQYVSFIATKGFSSIDDYLVSAGVDAVAKLAIPIHGALNIGKTVYDLIAEFINWFFAEQDIVSNGDPVGELPQVASSMSATFTGYDYTGRLYGTNKSYTIPIFDSIDDITFNTTLTSVGPLTQDAGRYYNSNFNSTWLVGNKYVAWYAGANSAGQYNIGQITNNVQLNLNGIVHISGLWPANATGVQYSMTPILLCDASSNIYRVYFCRSSTSLYDYSSRFYIYSNLYIDLTKENFDSYFNVPTTPGGFVVTPSDTVVAPPSVGLGQNYTVQAPGVTASDSVDDAITTAVAPLTTSGGLSNTANATGNVVPAEWAWLYEGVESIKNNTSDDKHGTDFIPSNTTMDFGFWHYVPDWISSVGAGFSMLVGVVTSLPSIMLAPLYGILVLGIVVALFHKLWGS